MMRKNTVFVSGILLLCAAFFMYQRSRCHSCIVPVNSFREVDFTKITQDTLVVFDVDQTLISPVDGYVLHDHEPEAEKIRQILIKKYELSLAEQMELMRIYLAEAERPLVEPDIIRTINELKDRGVNVIACSRFLTGARNGSDRTEKWRYDQLLALGFEGSFSQEDFPLIRLVGNPVFFHGILATDRALKGPSIGAFLDIMQLKPKKIVMFDDMRDYLESVKEMCCSRGIFFEGYQYLGAPEISFDKQLALFQGEYLITHHHWINDIQARKLMKLLHDAQDTIVVGQG